MTFTPCFLFYLLWEKQLAEVSRALKSFFLPLCSKGTSSNVVCARDKSVTRKLLVGVSVTTAATIMCGVLRAPSS